MINLNYSINSIIKIFEININSLFSSVLDLFPISKIRNPNSTIDFLLPEKLIPWSILCVIALICSYILFKHEKSLEIKSGIYSAYAYYLIGLVIGRILFMLSDLENWNSGETILYSQIVLFSYSASILAASVLIRMLENYVFKLEKKYLSLVFIIIAIISIIVAISGFFIDISAIHTVIRLMLTVLSSIGAVVLLVLFSKIVVSSVGAIRKRAVFNLLGILLIFAGSLLDSKMIDSITSIPVYIPPIVTLLGILVITINQKR